MAEKILSVSKESQQNSLDSTLINEESLKLSQMSKDLKQIANNFHLGKVSNKDQ
jgi:hypothetical protein